MLHKTRGIVLNKVKYSETSLIVKIYTELFGLQSYLVRGIRSKKSNIKPALLQHLALVELVVYHKEKKSIQNIKEIKSAFQFNSIPFDIRKSSIIVFLNEILCKVIKEEECNKDLFEFLFNSIKILDIKDEEVSDFHLIFLVQLTKFLGFFPKNNYSKTSDIFDLEGGEFSGENMKGKYFIKKPYSKYFSDLFNISHENSETFSILPNHRNILIEYILDYYRLHLPGIGEIKSHQVLKTVLND